ncbi:MAG: hypothetical protein ACNI27_03675 [Desulfovibrio sp.]
MANCCCFDCEYHENGHCVAAEEALIFEMGFLAMNAQLPETSSGTCRNFTATAYSENREKELNTFENEKQQMAKSAR